jgi:hypothetical protein
MDSLIELKEYEDKAICICPNGTIGETIELGGLVIVLPKAPKKSDILFHKLPRSEQKWTRHSPPPELARIRSMDEWSETPREFRQKFSPYIEEEFRRRREGVWFFNDGVPTYITGRHYMMLQWAYLDIGHPYYLFCSCR